MLSGYDTAELLAKWGTADSPTTEQMLDYMIQNMQAEEVRRKQNDRDLIFQQQEIEKLVSKAEALEEENEALKQEAIELEARIKRLEEQLSLNGKEDDQE